MRFEDLRIVWTDQASLVDAGVDDDLARVTAAGIRLHARVRVRDGVETVVAAVLFPVFVWLAFATPHLLSSVGAGIIALWCIVIPLRLRAARRPEADVTLPVTRAMELELERVRAQQRLLRSIVLWYAGPLWLGVTLFLVGPLPPWAGVLVVVGTTAFMGWLAHRNRLVVRLELDPWAAELERMLDGTRSPEDDPGSARRA